MIRFRKDTPRYWFMIDTSHDFNCGWVNPYSDLTNRSIAM